MDKTTIQLGQFKNVDAVNQDLKLRLPLETDEGLLIEYDIQNVLDVTAVYEVERQDVDTYRMYGEIEYLSPLNATITGYTGVTNFFTVYAASADTKSILTDFKFYLVAPATGYTALVTGDTGGTFQKDYEIISELENFEIYRAGYSTNVFGEQQYAWDFNIDFDIKNRLDGLNFPLTNLYLYAQYQPQLNGSGDAETISGKTYDSVGNVTISQFTPTTLYSGDTITGEVIEWNKRRFTQETVTEQEYYIRTPYDNDALALIWRYTPLIPISVDVFEDDLQQVNISGTSYEDIIEVPAYATKIDDEGNYVWRNIQDKGFVDPLTLIGVAFPFVNQRHYVFNNIVLPVKPDLDDANTDLVFTDIQFAADTFISSQPNSDLTDIGKPCA